MSFSDEVKKAIKEGDKKRAEQARIKADNERSAREAKEKEERDRAEHEEQSIKTVAAIFEQECRERILTSLSDGEKEIVFMCDYDFGPLIPYRGISYQEYEELCTKAAKLAKKILEGEHEIKNITLDRRKNGKRHIEFLSPYSGPEDVGGNDVYGFDYRPVLIIKF